MDERTQQAITGLMRAVEEKHGPVEYAPVCHVDEPDSGESQHLRTLEDARLEYRQMQRFHEQRGTSVDAQYRALRQLVVENERYELLDPLDGMYQILTLYHRAAEAILPEFEELEIKLIEGEDGMDDA